MGNQDTPFDATESEVKAPELVQDASNFAPNVVTVDTQEDSMSTQDTSSNIQHTEAISETEFEPNKVFPTEDFPIQDLQNVDNFEGVIDKDWNNLWDDGDDYYNNFGDYIKEDKKDDQKEQDNVVDNDDDDDYDYNDFWDYFDYDYDREEDNDESDDTDTDAAKDDDAEDYDNSWDYEDDYDYYDYAMKWYNDYDDFEEYEDEMNKYMQEPRYDPRYTGNNGAGASPQWMYSWFVMCLLAAGVTLFLYMVLRFYFDYRLCGRRRASAGWMNLHNQEPGLYADGNIGEHA